MKAYTIHLFDFLDNGKTIFEIPVFQRNYEWGIHECQRLFKDLTICAQDKRDHFIGAFVYVADSGPKQSHIYRIIDGQQRLMSLFLLLKAVADVDADDAPEIQKSYLTNEFLDANNHLKLKPVAYDSAAFDAVMRDKTDTYEEPSKIIENYRFFKRQIKQSNIAISDIFESLNRFTLVYIEIETKDEEDPQAIFESLNSTGISLAPSDLIRNFLLMNLTPDQQESLYETYWSKMEHSFTTNEFTEFVHNYLVMKIHRFIKWDHVYVTYKDFYRQIGFNSEQALADLYKFYQYYEQILKAQVGSEKVDKIINHINVMNSHVVYPYLMLLLDLQAQNLIEWDEIARLTHVIESYLMRLKICGHPTTGLNRTIAAVCNLAKDQGSFYQREIRLLNHNFPTDREVRENLEREDLYRQHSNLAKLVLICLEENRTKETINFKDAQIEHIMPQHLTAEWRSEVAEADQVNKELGGTIGNLTLTKYNQEMSNKSFAEKRPYYSKSNVTLTRDVGDHFTTWNQETIEQRTQQLIKEFNTVFPRPEVNIESVDLTGEHSLTEMLNVTNQKPTMLTLNGEDFPVKTWKQMLITLLNRLWNKDTQNFALIHADPDLNKALFENPREPERLENGEVIETNFSADHVLKWMRQIADDCGVSEQVKFTI